LIIVIATIDTTADSIDGLKDAVAKLESATREEAGCLDYTFCVELSDADRVRIVETWTDQEALIEHLKTPHVAMIPVDEHGLQVTDELGDSELVFVTPSH